MDLKPSTTIDEQLVLIEGKGIHINDMQAARDFLRRTGYYRLRAYFLPFKTGLRVKMCVWLGVSRGLDLAFLNAD